MSHYGSPNVGGVLVDGFNLISYLTSVGPMKKEAVVEDTTVLGQTWRGVDDTTLREFAIGPFEGFYDDTATTGPDAVFVEGNASSRVVCVLHDGNTVGLNFVGCTAMQSSYERLAKAGELHKIAVAFEGNGQMDDGIILHALGAETADGNTEGADSQNQTNSSILGGSAFLQLTAITLDTATNLAVTIRHSDDDITYATLGSFTVRTARGAERIAIAVGGTINKHIACKWVWTGGAGAGSTATFMVGWSRFLANNT